jgi:hypothetical protein
LRFDLGTILRLHVHQYREFPDRIANAGYDTRRFADA